MRALLIMNLCYCVTLNTFAIAPVLDTSHGWLTDTISIMVEEQYVTFGENLSNNVFNKNDQRKKTYENQVLTSVETLANVYIEQSGPIVIELNETNQYQLIYGNNGMDNAGIVVITDTIPNEFRPLSTNNPNCSIDFQTITCNIGDLAAGTRDTILIDFLVGNMPSSIGKMVTNVVIIQTDSSETNLSDNETTHETEIVILDLPSISGTIWHDDNLNGRTEEVEQGIEGVTIHLSGTDMFGVPQNATTTTDTSGFYSFTELNPGTYAVEEEQPRGWLSSPYNKLGIAVRTRNNPQDSLISHGNIGIQNGNEAFQAIVLESGYRGINYNFGEDLGSIGDTVWVDSNINGIREVSEGGIAEITVRLYQFANDSLIGTATTDTSGAYLFEDLLANDYYAIFDLSALPDSTDRVTIQHAINATTLTDSDADPKTGRTVAIDLAAGKDRLGWGMGIYGTILIGNHIWIDGNKNGIQDETDQPLEGVNVTLFNQLGERITTVQTNTDGYYYFHSDTLALANDTNDTLFYANTTYYLVVGLDQYNKAFELLFDSLQLTTDSIGNHLTDSDGIVAVNVDLDFNGFPFLKISTPAFGQVDTTFDFGFQPVELDWGDLPDTSAATQMSDYQTLAVNNGPRHIITSGLSLGITVDAEKEGQATDDASGDGDDEDGLTIFASTKVMPEGTMRLPFSYTNSTGLTAYLKIWIDWNGDGDFHNADEMVIANNDEIAAFANVLALTIPATAKIGCPIGMRVRLSLSEITSPYGILPTGEVEDYLIEINCPQPICLPMEIILKKK